jgi:hypothetical protein
MSNQGLPMPQKAVALKLDEALVNEMDAMWKASKIASRHAYIEGLVRRDLQLRKTGRTSTAKEIRSAEVTGTLAEILDGAMLEKLKNDPQGFVDSLDMKTLGQLAVQRMPKPKDESLPLQESYLSLTNALAKLPEVQDLAQELSKQKHKQYKMALEMEVQRNTLLMLRHKAWPERIPEKEMRAAFEKLGKVLKDWARDAVAKGLELEDFHTLMTKQIPYLMDLEPLSDADTDRVQSSTDETRVLPEPVAS